MNREVVMKKNLELAVVVGVAVGSALGSGRLAAQ